VNSSDLFFKTIRSNPTDDEFERETIREGTTKISDPESGSFVLVKKVKGKYECWPEGDQFKITKHPNRSQAFSWSNAYLRKVKRNPVKKIKSKKRILKKNNPSTWKEEGFILQSQGISAGTSYRKLTIIALTPDDGDKREMAGQYRFISKDGEDHISVQDSFTIDKFQRKGLASAAYSMAEKIFGKKIEPSDSFGAQTEDAKKLWNRPNRPFGKSNPKKLSLSEKEFSDLYDKHDGYYPAMAKDLGWWDKKESTHLTQLAERRNWLEKYPPKKVDKNHDEYSDDVITLYGQDWSIEKIAKKIRIPIADVKEVLIKNKIKIRDQFKKRSNPRLISVRATALKYIPALADWYSKLLATKNKEDSIKFIQQIIWLQGLFFYAPSNALMTALMFNHLFDTPSKMDMKLMVESTMKYCNDSVDDVIFFLQAVSEKPDTYASKVLSIFSGKESRIPGVSYEEILKMMTRDYVINFLDLSPSAALIYCTNFIRSTEMAGESVGPLKNSILERLLERMKLSGDDPMSEEIKTMINDQFIGAERMIAESTEIISSIGVSNERN